MTDRLRASIDELVMAGDLAAKDTVKRRLKIYVELKGKTVEKHYGPGPHPGTGTSQDVHGRKGGGGQDSFSAGDGRLAMERLRSRVVPLLGTSGIVDAEFKKDVQWQSMARSFESRFFDEFPWVRVPHTGSDTIDNWIDLDAEPEIREWMLENFPDEWETMELETASEWWDRHATRTAFERYAPDELVLAMGEMQAFVDDSRPFIRVDGDVWAEILEVGQVMNQNATGESSGYYDPNVRAGIDVTLFGYEEFETGNPEFPIYGYYDKSAFGDDDLNGYGQVAIELKQGVSTTITAGDSLDDSGFSISIRPTTSIGVDGDAPWLAPGNPQQISVSTFGRSAGPINDVGFQEAVRFVEAQYHEPIFVRDTIRAVHMPDYIIEESGFANATDYADANLPEGVRLHVYEDGQLLSIIP